MPDVTPNLGLVLSRYEDQEHLEYNANWKALDAASFQTFTVGVNPDALPFTASMTTDALSSSPIWASAVNNVLFFGRSTLSLVNQAAIVSLDVSGLSALAYLDCDTNQLTTLDVSGLSALVYLDCDTNQLTLDAVNGILAALVANGQANGYLNMSGGTNASPTDSADEATLLANGWTVTTN